MKEHIDVSLKMVDNFHVLLEHFVFIDEKKSDFIMFEIDSDVWETRANKDM